MVIPDLTNLSLTQIVATFLFFAAIDIGFAVVVAVVNHNFVAAYLLDFLTSHILKVGAPILGMAIVGHGVAGVVPAIPFATLGATAALAAYVVATIASVKGTFDDKALPPTTTSNIPPVTTTPPPPADPTPPAP